jgi:hypothetical protein
MTLDAGMDGLREPQVQPKRISSCDAVDRDDEEGQCREADTEEVAAA